MTIRDTSTTLHQLLMLYCFEWDVTDEYHALLTFSHLRTKAKLFM